MVAEAAWFDCTGLFSMPFDQLHHIHLRPHCQHRLVAARSLVGVQRLSFAALDNRGVLIHRGDLRECGRHPSEFLLDGPPQWSDRPESLARRKEERAGQTDSVKTQILSVMTTRYSECEFDPTRFVDTTLRFVTGCKARPCIYNSRRAVIAGAAKWWCGLSRGSGGSGPAWLRGCRSRRDRGASATCPGDVRLG